MEWAQAGGEPLTRSRLHYKRMPPPIDQCNGRTMGGTLVARLRAGISRERGAHLQDTRTPPPPPDFHLVVTSRMNHSFRQFKIVLTYTVYSTTSVYKWSGKYQPDQI